MSVHSSRERALSMSVEASGMQHLRARMSRSSLGARVCGAEVHIQEMPMALTRRELEILSRVCDGLLNCHIATELSITRKTVEQHLSSIYVKLGALNRAQAIINALRLRVVTPHWLNEVIVDKKIS